MLFRQWDFSAAELQRPRQIPNSVHRMSIGSAESLNGDEAKEKRSTFHPAPSLSEVAMIQPVMVSRSLTSAAKSAHSAQNKLLEAAVINQISFLPESVVTISKIGNIRFWMRGKTQPNGTDGMTNGFKQLKVTSSK